MMHHSKNKCACTSLTHFVCKNAAGHACSVPSTFYVPKIYTLVSVLK